MQEQRRQQYLDAMGIQTWFSRKILPHALPSERCEWQSPEATDQACVAAPETAISSPPASLLSLSRTAKAEIVSPVDSGEAIEPVADLAVHSHKTASRLSGLTEMLNVSAASKEQSSVVVTEASPKIQSTEREEVAPEFEELSDDVPQFRLELILLDDDKLAVVEIPHSAVGGFSRFHHQLLNDLLRSLGWPGESLKKHSFLWPLVSNGSIDQSAHVARDCLQAFLRREFCWKQPLTVLLLGRQAIEQVVGEEFLEVPAADNHETENSSGVDEPIHSGMTLQREGKTLLLCHSLNELMKLPGLKRETWAHLVALTPMAKS